jgi:type VII secretion protein EccE
MIETRADAAVATGTQAGAVRRSGGRRRQSNPVPGTPRALRFVLPIRLRYLIGWELAALAVLVAYAHRNDAHGQVVLIVAAALAVLLITTTSVRRYELTWSERFVARRRMRQRAQAVDPATDSPRNRLLTGLSLNTHIDRAGNRTGVIGSETGWSALIRLSDTATPDPAALIAAASRACGRRDLPLAAAQVISLNVPGSWQGEAHTGGDRTLRQFFLAVRTADRPSRRASLARGGGPAGAQRATARAAASLAFDLTQLGYACTVLDSAELDQQLQLLSGTSTFDVASRGEASVELLERKDAWSSGRMQQSCFRIGAGTTEAAALAWSVRPPLSFVVASCTITPGRRDTLNRDFLLRAGMIGQPGPLSAEQAARSLDRRLVPLRYRQQQYLRASLPLGL